MNTGTITIEGVFKSLDDWREERGLEHTVGNIAANIGEEIVEYLRATNDYLRVDALCDLCIFGINAIHAMNSEAFEIAIKTELLKVVNQQDVRFNHFPYICSLFAKSTMLTLPDEEVARIVISARAQITHLGFDFLVAMDETLKEIHSRTGAWNEETQKWEKFKTPEAMALWYEADYSKAKINESMS